MIDTCNVYGTIYQIKKKFFKCYFSSIYYNFIRSQTLCDNLLKHNPLYFILINVNLLLYKTVNNRIEEDPTNTDRASKEFDRIKTLSQNESNTNYNDNSLRSVRDTLCHCACLLKGHCRKFVVSVEPKGRRNHIIPQGRSGFGQLYKFPKTVSFLEKHQRYPC